MEVLTERRMPIPVKITPPGGYDCVMRIRVEIQGESFVRPTSLTAPPMVAENALRTFTVGSNHFVSPSLLLPDWSNAGTCCRSVAIISSEERQVSSLRNSGVEGRSFPVFLL